MKVKSNSINFSVVDVTALLAINNIEENDVCVVTDENQGGTFIYRSADLATNNGGTVFNGWCRQYEGAVNVKWFGAVGDGVTDDATSLQTAIDYAYSLGGSEVLLGNGNYSITAPLLVGGSSNVTLRGFSNLESGSSKITCKGTHCFKFKADTFSFLSIYNISFLGERGVTNFADQALGGSWAWSTMQGCYVVNFNIIDLLLTGVHFLNNNFQNHVAVTLRGGDYTFRDNYFGYDSADATKTNTDSCVAIQASTGVNFDGNYLTSMKTINAPIALLITNSYDIRANNNWIDGGYSISLKIEAGAQRVVCKHNRIAIVYPATCIPVALSNVRDVDVSENIISGLLASANFLSLESTLKRCIVVDNICNSWTYDTIHGYANASQTTDVYIKGNGLDLINSSTNMDVSPTHFTKTITNTGATTLIFVYVTNAMFKAGNYFIFKRTNTAQRVLIYNATTATTIYDSNTHLFNRCRIISYSDGSCVMEEAM